MGLSSIASMVLLAFIALSVVVAMSLMAAEQTKSLLSLKDRPDMIVSQLRAGIAVVGFNCTNYTTTNMNVTLYVENTGATNLPTDCVDLYVDGAWVDHDDLDFRVRPARFDPDLWNPSEQLKFSARHILDVGQHNATVVTCEGVTAYGVFNASFCGDSICAGGEYCDADNSSCADNLCFEPRCWSGCIEYAIINAVDTGECDATGAGCATNGCICNSIQACCGAGGSTCTQPQDCCSGSCPGPGPVRVCDPYP